MIPRPERKAIAVTAPVAVELNTMEEVELEDIDVHTIYGLSQVTLQPGDTYKEGLDKNQRPILTIKLKHETITYQTSNIAWVSRRKRTALVPKAQFKPTV